jgi:two-component system nitrogen regulation response regulator GlnG
MVWHPDVRRVGARALLSDRRTEISRLQPLFEAPEGPGQGGGHPLGDTYISSKTPSVTVSRTGDALEISPGGADAAVKMDGIPLTSPVLLSVADLERGVLLTLARRIVLCLHYARVVPPVEASSQHGLIGVGDSMRIIRGEIDRVADTMTPVLIRGETGTGKELVARALRHASRRAPAAFVAVNMSKLQPDRALAEIFGYERGAFTGAATSYPGQLRSAEGGTLFLDEIGLALLSVQRMLLRVIEDGLVQPLGSPHPPRKVDVRFIAATDTNLEQAIEAGEFSPALFERLARYTINLPPLRKRREDFGVLLLHLLRQHLAALGEPDRLGQADPSQPWLSGSSVAALAAFDWPDNIRQLSNAAERIVIDNRGRTKAELPDAVREKISRIAQPAVTAPQSRPSSSSGTPSDKQVAEAFDRHGGNLKDAAASLGVSRTTFYELRQRSPLLPNLSKITDAELLAAHAEHAGDVGRMAQELRVPVKALQVRLGRLLRKRS